MTNPLDDAINMGLGLPAKEKAAAPIKAAKTGFNYKMVPMPTARWTKMNATWDETASLVANTLEDLVRTHAIDGWEFDRVDTFTTITPQGCLGIVIGHPEIRHHYVATFRRPK